MRSILFVVLLSLSSLHAEHRLIVMRHGEASNNIARVYNSNPSHPNYRPSVLTEVGKEEVEQTAQKLRAQGFDASNIVAVFVSPLPRCVQTASLLAQLGLFSDTVIAIDTRLIERNAGDLEGKPSTIRKPGQGFESNEQVFERARSFYNSLLNLDLKGNVLVVTHSMVATDLIKLASGKEMKLNFGEAFVTPLKFVSK